MNNLVLVVMGLCLLIAAVPARTFMRQLRSTRVGATAAPLMMLGSGSILIGIGIVNLVR